MQAKQQPFLLVFVFAVVCVLSAIALVYTKHESRKLFVELEGLTHQRDELNIEWGQLQIEQSTWAQHARIEQVATDGRSVDEVVDEIITELGVFAVTMMIQFASYVLESLADVRGDHLPPPAKRRQLDLIQAMNREHLAARPDDAKLEGVIASMELGFRMQMLAPDLLGYGKSTPWPEGSRRPIQR